MKLLRYLLLILLLMSGGAVISRIAFPPAPVQLPPLPAEVVEVEVVTEIPIMVPGPERVVERVRWRTKEVAVEIPIEVIKEVIREVEVDGPPPTARVRVEADKFEGVNAEGKLVHGWKGWADCDINLGEDWINLVHQPLDLSTSTVVSTIAPVLAKPPMNRIDLGIGATTDGLLFTTGYHRRLLWKSWFGRLIMPDWIGADVTLYQVDLTSEEITDLGDQIFSTASRSVTEGRVAFAVRAGWQF